MKRGWWLPFWAMACTRAEPPPDACVELPPSAMDLGFEAPFSIRLRATCVVAGTVDWKQLEGAAAGLTVTSDGLVASARTPALSVALGAAPPWGVVPFSPRTRGALVFLVRWQSTSGRRIEHQVRVAAAARARGLPNVPVGARVHLGGDGWRIAAAPPDSAVRAIDPGAAFLPDVSGAWSLVDGGGRALALRSGRYDETPLDCGRSGCHPAVTAAAASTRMTTTLARGLREQRRDPRFPSCAIGCHATGEPHVSDGGFWHVSGELELAAGALDRWESMPRALRRLGGVGCLGCHGPGAVPEEAARWSILRADVCAICHDSPPRYGHVAAWRTSRMATADRDPRTRAGACARCHTTAGFLAATGAFHHGGDRQAPEGVGPLGIACAACHAVHAPGAGKPAALLRQIATPAALGEVPPAAGKSAGCLACHAPGEDGGAFSSAAAIWLGRGGLDPRNGGPLVGPAPHGLVADGCLACHNAGPPGLTMGAGHAFAAPLTGCVRCHGPRSAGNDDLRARAGRLWAALGQPASAQPPHASSPTLDRTTPKGRALWNVALVMEDPAAIVHNPRYARRLLDTAEEALR